MVILKGSREVKELERNRNIPNNGNEHYRIFSDIIKNKKVLNIPMGRNKKLE